MLLMVRPTINWLLGSCCVASRLICALACTCDCLLDGFDAGDGYAC
jgi:hypothetical protein